MRSAPESLIELLKPVVESLGYELVGIELFDRGALGRVLRVFIDSEAGITVDDCGSVSHQISGVLDVEDPISGHYDLEVSSPGLDRPLFFPEHFERFKGSTARLKLRGKIAGRKNITGVLGGLVDQQVLISEEGEVFRIPLEQIDSARLVPEF
jgi:ribosome maturation factor RimP